MQQLTNCGKETTTEEDQTMVGTDTNAKQIESERKRHGSLLDQVKKMWSIYWFEFEISWSVLVLFRFLFFITLAIDSWKQIQRGPKYDLAKDFNISHLSPSVEQFLRSVPHVGNFLLVPNGSVIIFCWMVMCFVSIRVSLGWFSRWEIILLTALQGYTYFISQLNLYQHEYLIFLILTVWSMIDWDSMKESRELENEKAQTSESPIHQDRRKDTTEESNDREETLKSSPAQTAKQTKAKNSPKKIMFQDVKCWPVRLMLVQVSQAFPLSDNAKELNLIFV